MRGLRSESVGRRVWLGRRRESRVKRTSEGVCRREEVRVKMFSGEKYGFVELCGIVEIDDVDVTVCSGDD